MLDSILALISLYLVGRPQSLISKSHNDTLDGSQLGRRESYDSYQGSTIIGSFIGSY